jgi:hypothetical protein
MRYALCKITQGKRYIGSFSVVTIDNLRVGGSQLVGISGKYFMRPHQQNIGSVDQAGESLLFAS